MIVTRAELPAGQAKHEVPVVEDWYLPAGHMEQPSRRDRSDALSTALEVTSEYKWPLK